MPIDRQRYPDNWNQIAAIAKDAAGLSCQHCGRQCLRPGEKNPHLTRSEWTIATLSVPERRLHLYRQGSREQGGKSC